MSAYDWSSGIKITFDKKIATDVEVVSGTEAVLNMSGTVSSSAYYSVYGPANAVDGNLETTLYFRNTVGWAKMSYAQPIAMEKFRIYRGAANRPRAFTIDGSENDVDWVTVASGECPNSTGWTEVTFEPATYQYWRVNITTKWSSHVYVYEIQFYESTPTYDSTGWAVSGYEYDKIPNGELVPANYAIKLTKTDSDYAIVIWLKLANRMKYPMGDITVTFTGTLNGLGNTVVAPFVLSFSPSSISPVFNPNHVPCLEVMDVSGQATLMQIYYEDYQSEEFDIMIEVADVSLASAMLTHIDDIET